MKLLTTIMILTLSLTAAASISAAGDGIPQRRVADMLYELAFANRKVYTRDIVQRLSNEESIVTTSEHYKDEKGLPLPAQMFRFAAEELLDDTGDFGDFWLALRSLDPINPAMGPLTPVEEQGLQHVKDNPTERFYAKENIAGNQSFVAIYADVANVEACVTCHNNHPGSPRKDFKLNDVMGGVIIRLFVTE